MAAAIQVCRTAALRPSLEVGLNLLWFGLALGSFTAWIGRCNPRGRPRRLELLSLAFVFALLFPVISPSDDLAQPLDDDACTTQIMISGLKAEKHFAAPVRPSQTATPAVLLFPTLLRNADIVTLPAVRPLPNAVSHATGNHSPPLA